MCRKAALAQSVSSRLSHTEGHDAREVFYLKYFFPSLYDVRMLSFKKKKKKTGVLFDGLVHGESLKW